MAEISIPLEELFAMNGHVADEPKLPRVEPARGVFVTSTGEEIEMSGKPISSLIIERLINEGRPSIPMTEVTLLGKHKQMEANPNDPGYQALLKEWEEGQQMKLMRYLFVVGVKGQPSQEFIDEQRPFFPDATDGDMKYLWVASRIPDGDVGDFTEALMGRTLPTAKGVDESANFTNAAQTDSP